LGFPTGWSFTTHKESSGAVTHVPTANFLAPLPGIEEEEAPTSTTLSHVNLAPSGGGGDVEGAELGFRWEEEGGDAW
jgi:hypothetical protein